LLALARVDGDRAPAEALDLAQAVRRRVDSWAALAGERGIDLVATPAPGVHVRASPARFAQVLDNLLANALEVASVGSDILITTRVDDGRAAMIVADRGPGMTDEQLAHAFDRFWRVGAGGDGSGLGLAIVRRLVAADDGDVELRRRSGGGLEAVVRLRLARPG
jgi:signal transduction histidine kinase